MTKKPGLRTFQYLIHPTILRTQAFVQLAARLYQAGGGWDLALGGCLYLHVPESMDIDLDAEIETMAKSATPHPFSDIGEFIASIPGLTPACSFIWSK